MGQWWVACAVLSAALAAEPVVARHDYAFAPPPHWSSTAPVHAPQSPLLHGYECALSLRACAFAC